MHRQIQPLLDPPPFGAFGGLVAQFAEEEKGNEEFDLAFHRRLVDLARAHEVAGEECRPPGACLGANRVERARD